MNKRISFPSTTYRMLYIFMGVGLVTFIAGLFFNPDRIWPNFLIAEVYLIGLGLGAGFFIAIQYVSNAAWGTAYRRIPEAMLSILPHALGGLLLLAFGVHTLYEWSHESVVMHDPVLQEKAGWLNVPFFFGRLLFYFAGWIYFSRKMVRHSLQQDEDDDPKHTRKNVTNSAIFILFGTFTFCFASFDLLMSLQPHWYSTVFGLLTLSSLFLNAVAAITIVAILVRRLGFDHLITEDHLKDLGILLMSFSVFWVYMWVSQHLLIWYSNIPEETSYYMFRHFGGWGSLSFLNVVLNWFIPFAVLMPRATKRNEKLLLQVSVVLVVGHWLDLYIMVMPVTFGESPAFGLWEIGLMTGALALFAFTTFRTLEKRQPVPVNDPYLVESLPEEAFPESSPT